MNSDCQNLAEARAYAKANLKQCAAEIRHQQDTGYLQGEFMRNLGEICMFAREHAMQVAESLVNRAALDFIADHDAEQAQQSERDAILARLEAVPVPEPFSWPTTGHGGRFVSAERLNDYRAAVLAAAKGGTQ